MTLPQLCAPRLQCSRLMARFAFVVLVCFIPVIFFGANFLECGDDFNKYFTFAYLDGSWLLQGVAAGGLAGVPT